MKLYKEMALTVVLAAIIVISSAAPASPSNKESLPSAEAGGSPAQWGFYRMAPSAAQFQNFYPAPQFVNRRSSFQPFQPLVGDEFAPMAEKKWSRLEPSIRFY